ncbi:MAG TPA: hypothetical protein PLU22_23225 [Polyangiaceae bacterium]|nr:hypothetical protein [Polyangiaceae bacterium]
MSGFARLQDGSSSVQLVQTQRAPESRWQESSLGEQASPAEVVVTSAQAAGSRGSSQRDGGVVTIQRCSLHRPATRQAGSGWLPQVHCAASVQALPSVGGVSGQTGYVSGQQ